MKKLLLTLICLTGFLPAFTAAYTEAERLQEAADLYFSARAQDALKKYIALSKETGSRSAFLNAIFIAMEQNQTKEAVDIALEAYRLFPQDNEVIEMTAEALLSDGQYIAAERLLSLLPQDNNTAGFFHINLARAQLGLNENKLAKYNLKQAVKAGSHPSLANFLLGQLYQEEKEYKKAAQAYGAAVDYDHQFLEARQGWARTLELSKQYDEAYRQYKMIFAADPKNTQAQEALQRLKSKRSSPEKEPQETHAPVEHTAVQPLFYDGPQREIKIGLGVSASGKPSPRNKITFSPSHAFVVQDENGKSLLSGKGGEVWQAVLEGHHAYLLGPTGQKIAFKKSATVIPTSDNPAQAPTIVVKNLLSGAGMSWENIAHKQYRGKLQILHSAFHNLVPINIVTLDEYVQGIIASEMPAGFPPEALRAQAVLARTYALKHLGKHKFYGYDLCDAQNCQVYAGIDGETEASNAAVASTRGQILQYENKPIESVFSANCGGVTQSAKDAGWHETPYLQTMSDYREFDFEHLEPYHFKALLQFPPSAYSKYDKYVSPAAFRWARVVSEEELRNVIKNQKKDIGSITALIVQKRSRAGYVTKLLVKGTNGSVTLEKENVIRHNLSVGMLRSSYFIVQPNYQNRQLKYFVFYGGGWGHGVGFCQTGAAGRAEQGQDYKTILQHYFPLAQLKEMK